MGGGEGPQARGGGEGTPEEADICLRIGRKKEGATKKLRSI